MDELKNLEQAQAQKSMNLAEWRASRRHEMDLPSGLHVTLRDVDMTDILFAGQLPPSVLELAKGAAETEGEADLEKIGAELIENNSEGFMSFLNAITQAALIDPAIGERSDDSHMTLDELPTSDKMAIMEFINRGAEQILPFRAQPGHPVKAAQRRRSVRKKAERVRTAGNGTG